MTKLQVPAIDPSTVEAHVSADKFYPRPFNEPCRGREWRQLGDAAGLTQFGVNLVRLQPGSWSSQRQIRERPHFMLPLCIVAASTALIGQLDKAQKAIARVRELDPTLRVSNSSRLQVLRRSGDSDRWMQGLRQAGLPE